MKFEKRILAMILALCMVFSLLPFAAIRVYAADEDYEEMFGITYEQLYSLYPEYLSPNDEEKILGVISSCYVDAHLAQTEKNPVLRGILDVFKVDGILSYSVERILEDLGMNRSQEEDMLWDTSLMLLNNIYSDEVVVNTLIPIFGDMLDVSGDFHDLFDKNQRENFKKNMSRILAAAEKKAKDRNLNIDIVSDEVFGELVDEMIKQAELVQRVGEEGLELHEAIQSMFFLWSIQRSSLMLLRESVEDDSTLAQAFDLIFQEMEKNPIQFIFDHYGTDLILGLLDDLLGYAVDAVTGGPLVKWVCSLMKIAGTHILEDFLHYASSKDIKHTFILMGYAHDLREAVKKWRTSAEDAFENHKPIGADDVEDYEFIYAAYIAAVKTALESSVELVFTEIETGNINNAIEQCDKLTYDRYMMLCLRQLRNDIDSGVTPSPTTEIGFPEWSVKATYPASGTITVTKDNANIMDRPCSVNTDMNAQRIEQGALGAVYTVTAICENIADNVWYRIITKSGSTGYIYSGNCTYTAKADVTVTGLSMPTTLEVGSRFWIKGIISTQYSTLLAVSCNIYDGNGNKVTGGKETISAKKYDLHNSAVCDGTEFNILPVGEYTCEIVADVDCGTACEDVIIYSAGLTIFSPAEDSTTPVPDAESASFVTRDDGVWLWPMSREAYNKVTDWAGCNGDLACPFHPGNNHGGCDAPHETSDGLGHNGMDIGAYETVYAMASGRAYTRWDNARGNYVIIEHPIGKGPDGKEWSYYTYYQHLSSFAIADDTPVEAGTAIGVSGTTGTSTGIHLHIGMVFGHSESYDSLWKLESTKWLLSPGYEEGRILINPARNSPAGFPAGYYVDNLYLHSGSVMFTFNKADVNIGGATTIECSHNYSSTENPATCTAAGMRTYTCTSCGHSYTEELPALGHAYVGVETSATCCSYAYLTHTCSRCGDSYIEYDELWSDWSDVYPDHMHPNLIQSATGYRYQDKEFTTSTSDSLPGWTLIGPTTIYGDYGPWSDWSDTPVAESEIVKVETRTVWPYYYFLCDNCGAHMHGYGTCWTWAGGCGAATYSHGWREVWSTVSWDNANLRDWHGTGKYYTYIDGELVFKMSGVSTKTQYRYATREATEGYNFYRWSDWSDWGVEEYVSSETRNVQSGEVYRYYTGSLAEHEWNDGEVTIEPTEDQEGEMTYTCLNCDTTKTETIPKKDHVHSYESVVTPPTCTEQGYTTHTCRCGDKYVDTYVNALGHDMGAWYVAKAATCTEAGTEQRDCSRCDYYETRKTNATGHNYEEVVTAPTCTEQGYTTHICNCGEQYVDSYVSPLGHDWDEGVVTKEPTEETEGERLFTCERCRETKVEPIPVKDHTHAYGEWEVWKEPSSKEPGEVRRYCECGEYESEEIPVLTNPFKDVKEGAYYYEPVLWAAWKGITAGVDATHFGPDERCTRGQVVTFLWRAMGCPEPESLENPFSDVKEKAFYYKAVLWAVENGITAGTAPGKFSPDQTCTRGQVVSFLWRALGKPEPTNTDHPFRDVKETAYYYKAMLWAVENGITAGYTSTTFAPDMACTRGQVVTFLYRTLRKETAT